MNLLKNNFAGAMACNYVYGVGKGTSKVSVTDATNDQECSSACIQKQASDATITGVTVASDGSCECVINMQDTETFETCLLRSEGRFSSFFLS